MTRWRVENHFTWTPHGWIPTPRPPRLAAACPHCGARPGRRCTARRLGRTVDLLDRFHDTRPDPERTITAPPQAPPTPPLSPETDDHDH